MKMKPFQGPDGTSWGVEVKLPGASNAMIVFHHPAGKTAQNDRYAWVNWSGPESRSVTSRVSAERVLEKLNDENLGDLFRRSFPISRAAVAPPALVGD
jgi:hypothetical protein